MSKRENMKWGTRSIVLSMLVATVVMGVSDRSLEVNAGEKVCDYIEKEESEKTACINNKYSYVVVKDGKSYHSNKEEFVKFYMEQEELGDTEGVFYENGEEMAEPENVSENQCGDSLYWNLNKDGIMTISGTGKMWDFRNDAEYFDYHECPWKEQKEQIKSVVFEEGITYIGADAFAECKNLAKVTFCDTLTYIGTFSFNLCENLENFVLPESLNYVDDNAFSNCPKLTSVRIPDNVTYIGAVAFEYDTALKEVYIGGSKEAQGYVVGNSVFRGCTALENIRVSEDNIGLSEKDGVLFSKSGEILMQYPNGRTDNTYKIPKETKKIGSMAFARSQNLENIEIPNGVTVIAAYAMYDCPKLKKVVIPDTVTYIEPGIGECCFYLETIDNKSETICPLDSTSGGIVWTNEAGEVISEIGKGVAYQHRVVEKIEMVDHISVRVGESIIVPMFFREIVLYDLIFSIINAISIYILYMTRQKK